MRSIDDGVRLMLAYKRGDEAAFDRLVHRYSGAVYSLLTRFLGPSAARDDLVQEVFLRVVRARGRYRPTARFTTWLYRIVFNIAVNERERGATPSGGFDEDGARSATEIADPRLGEPADELERADVVRAVRAAIDELPESQRMALILAKYEEMSYAEIAEVLDSSEKAIKSMIHRARENLRARLRPFLQEGVR